MAVRYTPGQMRSATGISQQTYRHWKRVLAPLGHEEGRSPCFTAGDLLAVVVVRHLTADFAISVGALSCIADVLFGICNAMPWPVLERGRLIIDLPNRRILFLQEPDEVVADGSILVIPLASVVEHLRGALLTGDALDGQGLLRFPPTPIPSRLTAESSRGGS